MSPVASGSGAELAAVPCLSWSCSLSPSTDAICSQVLCCIPLNHFRTSSLTLASYSAYVGEPHLSVSPAYGKNPQFSVKECRIPLKVLHLTSPAVLRGDFHATILSFLLLFTFVI